MEYENKFASKGVAGAGLGLGIAGTALGLLSGNGLSGILGANAARGCSEDHCVNRYELGMQNEIAAKDNKIGCIEGQLAQQAVYNATNTGLISCLQSQVAQLQGLTKVVIPTTSICPEPMARYNSWTAPTTTP